MKIFLYTAFVCVSLMATRVNCQNDSDGSWWRGMMENVGRMAEKLGSFLRTSAEQLREMYNALEKEVRERIEEFRGWTQETWSAFKEKWLQRVDAREDISESEKEDMRNVIERLQMPEGEVERK